MHPLHSSSKFLEILICSEPVRWLLLLMREFLILLLVLILFQNLLLGLVLLNLQVIKHTSFLDRENTIRQRSGVGMPSSSNMQIINTTSPSEHSTSPQSIETNMSLT